MKKLGVRQFSLIAMLGAIGAILMVIRFPLPFLPPFLSFDLSAIPELIGGFALGPVAAVLVVIMKITIQLVISGTNSMFTGELQGFLLSCAFVVPASYLYQRNKTRNEALIGMGIGVLICTVVAIFTNLYLIIPFYIQLYGMRMDQIIQMCQTVNPAVDSVLKLVLIGIVPFNLIKCIVNCLVTFAVYKKISPLIHRFTTKQ